MAQPRFGVAALALGDWLYVVGGTDGTRPLPWAERLGAQHVAAGGGGGAWEQLAPLAEPRCACAIAAT